MKRLTRRQFLKISASAGAGLTLGGGAFAQSTTTTTALSQNAVAGANNDIRVAVIGLNGRGGVKGLIKDFQSNPGVRIVAICDVDQKLLDAQVALLKAQNVTVKAVVDMRRIMDDKEIDAVVIATPNHWHALATIWACQAGKDVYLEKPSSHNLWESRQTMAAVEKYKRIVQVGAQRRSTPAWGEALAWVNSGALGKVLFSRGLCYKPRLSIGKVAGPQPIPDGLDYDLWCGPREKAPLMRTKLHYDWHWIWAYGNGDLGNQGAHQMDVAAWAIGADKLAPSVTVVGGRFGYKDDGETPNTIFAIYDTKPAPIIFEVQGLPASSSVKTMNQYKGIAIGNVVECEGGWIEEGHAFDKDGKEVKTFAIPNGTPGAVEHAGNFLKAMRSRKNSDLTAPLLSGHIAAGLVHQANICYRAGQAADHEAIQSALKGNAAGLEIFERYRDHLSKNGVDIKTDKAILGPTMNFDPASEKFTGAGADKANALLREQDRAPFTIPESV